MAAVGLPVRTLSTGPKGERSSPRTLHAEFVQFVEGSRAGIREEQHVERGVIRQGLLLDSQGQQWRLEFEVRLVGQDGLRLRVGLQLLRDGLGSANEISLVGNVGHDGGPRRTANGRERRRPAARGTGPRKRPGRRWARR